MLSVESSAASRSRPSLARQVPLLVVLAVMFTGLTMVFVSGDFERGTVVFAGAVLLAGLSRLVLPRRWAGLLSVRSRWLDSLTLLAAGISILVIVLALLYDWDPDLVMRWLSAAE